MRHTAAIWLAYHLTCHQGGMSRWLVGVQASRDSLRQSGLKGVHLAGNYCCGVALGRCVESGSEIAAEVAKSLKHLRHAEFWQSRRPK